MFIIAVCKEVCKCQNWWNKLLFFVIFLFLSIDFFLLICWNLHQNDHRHRFLWDHSHRNLSKQQLALFLVESNTRKANFLLKCSRKKVFNEKKKFIHCFSFFKVSFGIQTNIYNEPPTAISQSLLHAHTMASLME